MIRLTDKKARKTWVYGNTKTITRIYLTLITKRSIGKNKSQIKQTDLKVSKREVFFFLVVINDSLCEMENWVYGSLFTDELEIYTTTRILTSGYQSITKN